MLDQRFKLTLILLAAFTASIVFSSKIISLPDFTTIAQAQAQPEPPDKTKRAYKALADLAEFGKGEGNEEDKFCKSHLFGTTSQETCVATCPMPGTNCRVVQTHKAANNPELSEDTNCYGCAAALTCYDFGYMYMIDCLACEANPKKVCVNAVTFPGVGGFGGGAFPLPTDPAGNQCWDCVDRKDQCNDKWPGSTWDATCGGACALDEKCQQVGIHPDGYGCFQCVYQPVSCKEIGLLTKADCGKCPPKRPVCQPLMWGGRPLIDDKGETCYDCFKKPPEPPPPPPPPPPKEMTCKDYHLDKAPCKCGKDEIMISGAYPNNVGGSIECCSCQKHPCYPDMTQFECKEQCESQGRVCMGRTTERGKPPCYWCTETRRPPETCEEAGMASSCKPNPCSADMDCSMQQVALSSGKQVKCAVCEMKDEPPPPNQCEEYGGFMNCAPCYERFMRCEMKPVGDRNGLDCAFCKEPCHDSSATFGNCQPGMCSEGYQCVNTQDGCHLCNPIPECEHGSYDAADCGNQCDPQKEECVFEYNREDEKPCYSCQEKDTCATFESFDDASCGGQCKANQRCEAWDANNFWSQVSGLKCYDCVDIECPDGSSPGVCARGLCPQDLRCRTVGDFCHACEPTTTEPLKDDCAKIGKMNRAGCDSCTQAGNDCMPAGGAPNGEACYECKQSSRACQEKWPGTYGTPNCDGRCAADERCYGMGGFDKDGQQISCYQCQKYGYCKEEQLLSGEECDACYEKPGFTCVPAGNVKGEACYRCIRMLTKACSEKWPGTFGTDNCDGTCDHDERCTGMGGFDSSYGQITCYQCEKFGGYCAEEQLLNADECEACYDNPGHTCVPAGNVKGEACYRCIKVLTKACSEKWPGTFGADDCDGTCDHDERCVGMGGFDSSYGQITCYQCEKYGYCHEKELLSADDCDACYEKPGYACVYAGKYKDEDCYECKSRQQRECDEHFPGMQSEENCKATCDAPMECHCNAVFGDDDGTQYPCCKCETAYQKCSELELLSEEECADCDHDPETECTPAGKTKENEVCYECKKRPVTTPQCDQGTLPGLCPGTCDSTQECVPKGNCHSCIKKIKKCEDMGLLDQKQCTKACPVASECTPAGKDETGTPCYECTDNCDYGEQTGKCSPGSCPQDQECNQLSTNCFECKSKTPECPQGTLSGVCQPGACDMGETCATIGDYCHQCEPKSIVEEDSTCEDNYLADGGCPAQCSSDQLCVPHNVDGKACHLCSKKAECSDPGLTREGCLKSCPLHDECVAYKTDENGNECWRCMGDSACEHGQHYGVCQDDMCGKDQYCYQVLNYCYECKDKRPDCPDGSQWGTCPGNCTSEMKCIQGNDHCYSCDMKECADYDLMGDCTSCELSGGECKESSPRPGLTCYECKENPCKPNLTKEQCAANCEPEGTCTPLKTGTQERGSAECFKCTPKTEECPHGTAQGACTQSSCSSQEECVPAGENCHSCEPKQKNCATYNLWDDCSGCNQETQECIDVTPEPGLTCKGCKERTRVQARSCQDLGYMYLEDCGSQCGEKGGKCEPRGQDDGGTRCFECIMSAQRDACKNSQYKPGACHAAACKGGEKCVPRDVSGQACHECYAESAVVCPQGFAPGTCAFEGAADKMCSFGRTCIEQDGPCWKCVTFDMRCEEPLLDGACPAQCPSGQMCENLGPRCHQCVPQRTATGGDTGGTTGYIPGGGTGTTGGYDLGYNPKGKIGWTPGNGLEYGPTGTTGLGTDGGGGFIPEGGDTGVIPGGGGTQTGGCESGYASGTCAQQMECFPGECYEKNGCFLCKKGDCHEPHFRGEQCEQQCVSQGGKCVPSGSHMATGIRGMENYASFDNCYKCEFPESCEKYGEASSCQMCRSGTICVPGRTLDGGFQGRGQRCVKCIRPKTITVTTVVIIIETPRGRYILEQGDGPDITGFVPSQVMAMAQVTDPGDAAQKIAGMLPGGSSAFGMLSSSMSMGSMGDLLKQSMEKKGKYADDCFEKDFKAEELPKSPPPATGNSGAAASGSGKQYGEDPSKHQSTGGPIVSCGTLGKEKALAVMDAHGRPVEVVTQQMLKDNPNAIADALQKAQGLSEELMAMREGGMQGAVERYAQKAINKVTSALQDAVKKDDGKKKKKKKGEEEPVIEPNDPFYKEPNEDKKDLGGAMSTGNKAAPVSIGSPMKMGLRALGGGAGAEKKEEMIKHQWGLYKIGYTPYSDPNSAWNVVDEQSKNVLIAIIDSGLDLKHPDGPQYIWTNDKEIPENGIDDDQDGYIDDIHGWNFLNNNNDVNDLEGHGTFVAGIIAAKTNNGIGVAGINPGAVIMPVKVADANGETNSLLIARAVFYAVDHGAQVINLSLGSRVPSQLEQAALQYADAKGVFVAVASGNVGEYIGDHGPASEKGAFSVGSIDFAGTRSTISNWGPNNAIMAPGDSIMSILALGTGKKLLPSLVKQGYFPRSGTSFSTPMVAATASLLLVQNPNLKNYEIADILYRTAGEMYEEGWDGQSGAGLLNAAAALRVDVNDKVTVVINQTRINRDDKDRIESVDVFGTVRGEFKDFVVEVGKGERANKFNQVAGPFTQQADFDWIAHLDKGEVLRGSEQWIVRINATDKNGKPVIAQTLLELK